ncbi:nucleotidyl transferase AbiEii/AbiGii toxin family protein [Patescibacteria group bacterium]|nr:nucleotidyl transferase AbiEii/AbiGii toxin family protein [Patescibacteria group bacterium]
MYLEILDKKRINILPQLGNFKDEYYLAGGTALALQLGHRDSVDFDFFKKEDIDTTSLFKKLKEVFSDYKVYKINEEKNTLDVLIDDEVNLSFFSYDYPCIEELEKEKYFSLASVLDIASMKLSAILSRATNKDYIDLYYIFQEYNLKTVLDVFKQKYQDTDLSLVLKSLVYFEDIREEPILFTAGKEIDFKKVQDFLIQLVRKEKDYI